MPGMDMGKMGGMGSMAGGMMGSMLPSVSSASSSNVAGVLSYCVQNNYLGGNTASSTLGSLTGRQGITASPDYAAGQQGQLLTGGASPFSLSSLGSGLKQKLCSSVLSRAQGLL